MRRFSAVMLCIFDLVLTCTLSMKAFHFMELEMQLESPRVLDMKNELLIHTSTWMDLRCIILSERSQKQKSTLFMILFIIVSG